MKSFSLFLLFCLATLGSLQANPYKIRLAGRGNNMWAVQMRIVTGTAPTTSNYVADLVFGIRWIASASLNLNAVTQSANSYNIGKSGIEVTKASNGTTYEFQAFSANSTPYTFPEDWTLGTWVDIMTITTSVSATLEICPQNFDTSTNLNFNVDNTTDETPDIEPNLDFVLPIELQRFAAQPTTDHRVLVDWQTAREREMFRFELERSDNAKTWAPLSIIAAKNSSSQVYTYEDTKPLPTINYYRLKMVNTDGTFRYSETKTAVFSQKQGLRMSPNPAKVGDVVFVKANTDAPYTLQLMDATGRVVLQTAFIGETRLHTEGVAAGTYVLRSEANGVVRVQKLIVQ